MGKTPHVELNAILMSLMTLKELQELKMKLSGMYVAAQGRERQSLALDIIQVTDEILRRKHDNGESPG